MGVTPKASLRYAELTDSPNANTLSQNLATDLDSLVIPKYTSTGARDTANPTPAEGDFAYITGTTPKLVQCYSSSAWVTLHNVGVAGSSTSGVVFQAADLARNNNTLTSCDLTFNVVANAKYVWDAYLLLSMDQTAAGMQINFVNTATGSTVRWAPGALDSSVTSTRSGIVNMAAFAAAAAQIGGTTNNTSNQLIRPYGYINTVGTAGSVTLQIAQQVTTAGGTHSATLMATSLLRWTRVA